MLYCYACCCCYHYYLCMSLVVPLVLNIVYGSCSLLWPIIIADMNICNICIYIMLPQWPPVCHEFAMKTQPCFFKRISRLCRRLLPTYDFGSVLRCINRPVRESEGEIVDTPSSGYIRIISIYGDQPPPKERMSCMRFIIFQAFAGCLNLTLCTDTWRSSMESCCLFIVVWSVRWSLCSQSQVFLMLLPVLNSRSTFLCLSSCQRGSQSWLDSGSSLCCSFGTNCSFPLCFVCLCPCVRVAAKTLLSNLLNRFSQSQWQEVHLPTMTYRACIFILTDLSKTKLVELFENAWDEDYHSQFSYVFCWMAPWKLFPPNLHPPHFPQQITPTQALFNDTTGTPSPFTKVPERAADRIDPDTLQMTSTAADSEDPQEVTSVSLEGWESSLWMVKDVVITWFAGWFWF